MLFRNYREKNVHNYHRMDIRIENEIRMLRKLGLNESMATIVASANNNLPHVAQNVIEQEKNNNQILMEETLMNLVPMETIPEEVVGTFIVCDTMTVKEISK